MCAVQQVDVVVGALRHTRVVRVAVERATDEHRSIIADKVAAKVRRLIDRVPLVPATLGDPSSVRAALEHLGEGLFVAVDGSSVVGHLGWHDVPDVRRSGRPGVWMPEYAHFAETDAVRDALFTRAAQEWDVSGRRTLMASMLIDDVAGWWHLSGFGTFLHDTVLAAASFAHQPVDGVTIAPAVVDDADALAELDVHHCAHYALPPTFMVPPTPWTAAQWRGYVADQPGLTQVARADNRTLGFVRVEFDRADLPLLEHTGSATVTGIFVRSDARTSGIGAALLSHAAAAAGAAGARVLTADHETTNPTARRFWPRHATTVAVSMMRILERH
jgi:GNAT superfamily N-acetyltransferase